MAIYDYLDLFIPRVTLHPLKNRSLHRKGLDTYIECETDYRVRARFQEVGRQMYISKTFTEHLIYASNVARYFYYIKVWVTWLEDFGRVRPSLTLSSYWKWADGGRSSLGPFFRGSRQCPYDPGVLQRACPPAGRTSLSLDHNESLPEWNLCFTKDFLGA